ncbi:hypothetical protein MJO29_003854 [Puccinia striiformis f. sp. tritici]|nr:hypothetical protein MJO29_003854 [Puccinia striiformis f. sp. tritici]
MFQGPQGLGKGSGKLIGDPPEPTLPPGGSELNGAEVKPFVKDPRPNRQAGWLRSDLFIWIAS